MAQDPADTTVTTKYTPYSQVEEAATTDSSTSGSATSSLTFPSTLTTEWNHIIHFQRYEYARSDARTAPTESKAGSLISLPIPINLEANYSADWENESLGAFGNQVAKAGADIYKNMKAKGGGMDALKASVEQYASTAGSDVAWDFLQAVALDNVTKFGAAYNAVSRVTGLAVNPYKAVLYRSPDFRSFQFSYKFIPSNKQEADTILSIVTEFKTGMHPSFDAAFADNVFKYPDIWRITIPGDKYLFKFLTCALKSVTYNPHGEGTKTYFKSDTDNIPLSITLDLGFQELSVLTKEDIAKGY